MTIQSNGTNPLLAQYVSLTWKTFSEKCRYNAGVDGFNKGLCNNAENKSWGEGERPGTWRCSLLACPLSEQVYILSKKHQNENARRGHLTLVHSV